jgi:hypothetical protein
MHRSKKNEDAGDRAFFSPIMPPRVIIAAELAGVFFMQHPE